MLSYVVFTEIGRDIDDLTILKTELGRPYIKEIDFDFNLSNTNGMITCATGKKVGIDCEKIKNFSIKTAERVCTENELRCLKSNGEEEFVKLWTFKEAFVKMLGIGLRHPLKSVTLDKEKSVLRVFPNLKIFTTRISDKIITAVGNGETEINIQNVDLLS